MLRSHNVKDKYVLTIILSKGKCPMTCGRMIGYYDAIKLIFRKRRASLGIVIVRKVMLRVLY